MPAEHDGVSQVIVAIRRGILRTLPQCRVEFFDKVFETLDDGRRVFVAPVVDAQYPPELLSSDEVNRSAVFHWHHFCICGAGFRNSMSSQELRETAEYLASIVTRAPGVYFGVGGVYDVAQVLVERDDTVKHGSYSDEYGVHVKLCVHLIEPHADLQPVQR